MIAAYRALVGSGAKPHRVFFQILWAMLSLTGRGRRARLESALMARKEICQLRDATMDFVHHYLKDSPGDCVGRTQIQEALYRPEDSSQMFLVALRELVREGYLKIVPTKHFEPIFRRTSRRYFSKVTPITAELQRLGVYSRAISEHKPYYTPRSYKL